MSDLRETLKGITAGTVIEAIVWRPIDWSDLDANGFPPELIVTDDSGYTQPATFSKPGGLMTTDSHNPDIITPGEATMWCAYPTSPYAAKKEKS